MCIFGIIKQNLLNTSQHTKIKQDHLSIYMIFEELTMICTYDLCHTKHNLNNWRTISDIE